MSEPAISVVRVYDHDALQRAGSGARILVDRLWPRGIRKEALGLDDWNRDVAPSAALRKWFGHRVARWDEFRRRYRAELDANPDAVERCLVWCRKGPVLLLYGAHDERHNQAVVLAELLTTRMRDRK